MGSSKLIYVADPMCSWCWGFAPEFHKLRLCLDETFHVSLCMGNLRSGHTWDEAFRTSLRRHWEAVHTRTGQPFDLSLFERGEFNYTTEPACRAVCTGRVLDAEKAFDLLAALQNAFYREGRDVTDTSVICALAAAVGYDTGTFEALFSSEAMHRQVASDRSKARAYGAAVFPSLVFIDAEGHLSVLKGYRTCDEVLKLLGVQPHRSDAPLFDERQRHRQ